MRFVNAFNKTADNAASGGHNNQGIEFQTGNDVSTTYGANAGGMAPSGIPSYQPSGTNAEKLPRGMRMKILAKQVALGKIAAVDGVGTAGQGASTLATQLKWESTGNDTPESMGYNPESGTRYKAYMKALRQSRSNK